MTTPWDTGATLDLVMDLHGKHRWVDCRASLASVILRQQYAALHYTEATEPVDRHIALALQGKDFLRVFLGHTDEERAEYSDLMVRTGAHITAMVQSLHSVPDILAHAVYFCLAMDSEPDALKPRNVGAKEVLKRLAKSHELLRLHERFAEVTAGEDFKHIDALANTAKHRSIVRPGLSQARVGSDAGKYSLKLDSVEYDGTRFTSAEVKELLPREFERQSFAVADTGNELNAVLAARLAARPSPCAGAQ